MGFRLSDNQGYELLSETKVAEELTKLSGRLYDTWVENLTAWDLAHRTW